MSGYKPIDADRSDVLREKRIYGIWYGAALGLSFSIFAWGVDSYLLSQTHSLYPWTKFIGGLIPCMVLGGLAGWISARLDKPLLALFVWAAVALSFAWLTVMLPLQITPRLLELLEPGIRGLLHYEYYPAFSARIGVAFAWLVIFVSIAGLLQLPLTDSAVFSMSILGKIAPMLVSLVLMGISGTIIDGLNNELLRTPVQTLDATIQFQVDHRGQEITPLESRRMRLGSLRAILELVTPNRQLIVSGYDEQLGEVTVLVKFDRAWVECQVFYGQPVNCKQVQAP